MKRPARLPLTAAQAVRRALASSVHRLAANESGVLKGRSEEALHRARVAVRRLRSDLRGFRSLVDRDWSTSLRQELRWLGTEFGDVRDLDVLIHRLLADAARANATADTGVNAVIASVRDDRKAARKRLLEGMQSERYARLRARLALAARAPRFTLASRLTADEMLRPIVKRRWKRLKEAVEALSPRPAAAALHRVRILAKRCRYAAEATEVVAGKAAREFAAAAARLQDILGELNDAIVACRRLRKLRRKPEMAMAIVGLLAMEASAAARARDSWPAAWHALSDKELRTWF